MGIILDLILVIIFAFSVFMGYKKGLIKVVYKLCAFILAFIITWMLYAPVSNFVINNTKLDENIKNAIIEKGVTTNTESSSNKEGLSSYVEEYIQNTINDAKNNAVKSSADVIAEKTVAIIVAVGLFIVVRIALILLKFVAEGIAELPIIKQCNILGGVIYGIMRGIFVIYLIFTICFIMISINNNEFLSNLINTSILSKFVYSNNIILNIIF